MCWICRLQVVGPIVRRRFLILGSQLLLLIHRFSCLTFVSFYLCAQSALQIAHSRNVSVATFLCGVVVLPCIFVCAVQFSLMKFINLIFCTFPVSKGRGDHPWNNHWGIHLKEKKVVGSSPRKEHRHLCSCPCKNDDRCGALPISSRCWLLIYYRLPTTWWRSSFKSWVWFMHVHARSRPSSMQSLC